MSKPRKKALSKPIMIRMETAMHENVKALAEANSLTTSEIIRLAVARQLPALRSGNTKLIPA